MMIHLKRNSFTKDGVFGQFLDDSGVHICYTLEHAYPQPNGGYTPKLQEGVYTCVYGSHMLHSGAIDTFEITGVAGHQGILIHYGNFNNDSEGCVLVGQEILTQGGTNYVSNSRNTWRDLMNHLGTASFQLEVTGG